MVRGRGVATVTATGPNSTVGRMAALLDTGPQVTPLQRRLRGLSRLLAAIVAILCVAVGVMGLTRGEPLELMVVTAISLAVAAVPESIPTGDGVNDGPALRHADIGVAMGGRGTEVARQAADLVLADDELGTMVTAISEGRRIYDNVRRFLLFGMSGGAAEIMVMLAGPFLGMALPLLPAQILWINLLTHGLTGVALGAEPAAEAVMRRPPRPPAESVLGAGLWKRILRIAVLITAVTLVVALWGLISGREWQTMAFLTLGTMQLTVAIALRARPRTWANPFLLLAVGSAWLLQLAAVYVPPLAELLGTRPLPLRDLAVVTGVSVLGYAGIRLDRKLHPR